MHEQPQQEHHWLSKLVGSWTFETECQMGPDQPPMKSSGSEVVKSLGGMWTIGEGQWGLDSDVSYSIMTLGYNPKLQRFVGTFVGSMMTHLWIYNGQLDAAQRVLTLDAEGPNFTTGGMTQYQDIIEFITDDHRILRSQLLGENGEWIPFMVAHYRRTS